MGYHFLLAGIGKAPDADSISVRPLLIARSVTADGPVAPSSIPPPR